MNALDHVFRPEDCACPPNFADCEFEAKWFWSETVSDHGHPWRVPHKEASIVKQINGAEVRIALRGSGLKLEHHEDSVKQWNEWVKRGYKR